MNEHPHRGGSYRREPDGSLTRMDDTVPPPAEAAAPTPPADEPRPTRSKRKETKHG